MIRPSMTFAIDAHGEQRYGDEPYRSHLYAVVQVLKDFGFSGKYLDAGALHDTIEDTYTTRDTLSATFGKWVADVVWACTGTGSNRKERNAAIYAKISMMPEAASVKTADRIANVEHAEPGGKHAMMYISEIIAFHHAVAKNAPPAMIQRLERAYKEAVA
jgi:(p)ppGpp synthase/HD superfamily hydrolase